jgi:hypothetical protein
MLTSKNNSNTKTFTTLKSTIGDTIDNDYLPSESQKFYV